MTAFTGRQEIWQMATFSSLTYHGFKQQPAQMLKSKKCFEGMQARIIITIKSIRLI